MRQARYLLLVVGLICASCNSEVFPLGNGYVYYDFKDANGDRVFIERDITGLGSLPFGAERLTIHREIDPVDSRILWEWDEDDSHVAVEPVIGRFVNGDRFIIGYRSPVQSRKARLRFYVDEAAPRPAGYFIVDKRAHKIAYGVNQAAAFDILRQEGYLPTKLDNPDQRYLARIRVGARGVELIEALW